MIQFNLPFKIVGHVIEWTEGKGVRPATAEERQMYWMIQRLLSTASGAAGIPVTAGDWVSSVPGNWSCSICGQGLIPVPGTNRRSFSHACVPSSPPLESS